MTPLAVSFLISLALLMGFKRLAPRLGFMSAPNDRSAHKAPTAVGGGICFAIATLAGLYWAGSNVGSDGRLIVTLQLGGLLVASVGLVDDRFNLGAWSRLTIYLLASLVLALQVRELGPIVYLLLCVVAITWVINLVNFMDGIDGFVVTQALCVAMGTVFIAAFLPHTGPLIVLNLTLAAALLPFLWFNWPPATVFMGDSGSVFLGFYLAAMGILAYRLEAALGAVWLILMMPFLVDATATLFLRLCRGLPPHQAHSEHAYQRLTRGVDSPLPINLGLLAIHGIWQFPCAVWAVYSSYSLLFPVIFSAIPSILLVVYSRRYS